MDVKPVFDLVDKTPFVPFTLELVNGRRVRVGHPENIVFLPSRRQVRYIIVAGAETDEFALFGPEMVAATRWPRGDGDGAARPEGA